MKSKRWSKPITGEWASALQKYILLQADVVPAGWKKVGETLGAMGLKAVGTGSRSRMLSEMVENGILEKKQFRVTDLSGRRLAKISHYRLAKTPATTKNISGGKTK
jgi:hypothetical protein